MRELLTCLQCAYCAPICPTLAEVGWESRSPRGILYALKRLALPSRFDRLLGWDVKPDELFVRRLYQCTNCGRCAQVCHVNIDLPAVYDDVKEWLVRQGHPLLEPHRAMVESIREHHNFYSSKPAHRSEWAGKARVPEKADTLFFVGCTMSHDTINLARDTVRLMRAAGVDFTVMGADEWCCGHPLLLTGQADDFRRTALHNIEAIRGTGATRIVTGCPGCLLTLKKNYPDKAGKLGAQVLHTSELLAELVDAGKLKFARSLEGPAIYHDPCTLGRRGGVYEAPRKVLENLPGAGKVLEFEENRVNGSCCGGGGMLRALEEEMAVHIAARRIQAAEGLGARMLVSACPACRINLAEGMREPGPFRTGTRPVVRDLVELAVRAL